MRLAYFAAAACALLACFSLAGAIWLPNPSLYISAVICAVCVPVNLRTARRCR